MSFKCKECDKEFGTEPAMHRHIKIHDMTLADYYTKNFPRKNLLTGELLPFKNKKDYLKVAIHWLILHIVEQLMQNL